MAKKKQGDGSVFQRKDGRWEGRIVVGYKENGYAQTKNVTAHTKTECQEKLAKLREECGRRSEKIKPDMPFGDWIDFWYQNYSAPKLRPTTQACYSIRIYTHIIPSVGSIPLNKLTQNDLQQFYARLKKSGRKKHVDKFGEGLSDRMVRSCHTTCRTALEKAVNEGLIRINPAVGCKLPPKKAKEMQVLTPPEITRFLIQAREEGYYELFLLELTTGMRRGEILALKWRDLNLKTGELHISRQVLKVNGKVLISTPKTKSSNRMILLPPEMLELLAELKTRTDSEWIFPSPLDLTQPRHPSAVYHRFQKILERANCKLVRFHDLCHTFATMALENGMDIKTLSAMIGHVSAETTLNIYSHITDTMQQQAAARIDREIAGADTPIPEPNATDKASDGEATDQPTEPKFEPYKGKIRKPGTGCVTMINDHLYEGRFSPRVNGKRIARNIYATTREECEEKLKTLIVEMKKEIAEIKAGEKATNKG